MYTFLKSLIVFTNGKIAENIYLFPLLFSII